MVQVEQQDWVSSNPSYQVQASPSHPPHRLQPQFSPPRGPLLSME